MTEPMDLIRPRRPERRIVLEAKGRPVAIDASRTALVVVDMQNDFLSDDGWFAARGIDGSWAKALCPVIDRATALARREGLPVIWVNWGTRPDLLEIHPSHRRKARPSSGDPGYEQRVRNGRGPVLERGSWGAAIVPELTVADTDLQVEKHRYTGFFDNELDSVLRNLDVTTLLVAGINLDRCVLATVMDACHAGYDAVLLADATGTHAPAFCAEAALVLIEQVFGFVSSSAALAAAFAAADPPPSPRDGGAAV
ncbi:cysteine hydrolase [Rhodoplanes sp. TEM]|uniref:Cysteine hydrolase n=1 Tax=Rhodoplanes tepidamans TaxID=200616 RepID=A0ABT5J9H6_RHOTP|nr:MULTISPECIES: isochorismatase family cysteine hydrolase [Rhodoplanes]MDC7786317.1 cysteine hydrolase [Rhodoplanes tepidamans]MDC7984724.1 cysteine hydrolase [Rhodoplanes sp. TEM]MDQ0354060.1 nicotinamidase-related amidase [Rhodoplanes tepidamans]